jgi:hypothetical protein
MRRGSTLRGSSRRRSLCRRARRRPLRCCACETAATAASRAKARATAATGEEARATASAGRAAAGHIGMSGEARERALAEVAFCDSVLAKGGLNVLTETFRDAQGVVAWEHYPPGDVFDPASGSQWFYHCHPAEEGAAEHGHFHCFIRPRGPDGPIHHLAAVGVDAYGRTLRLFTVNQWVVGDDWLDAEATIALLPRFDMQMPRPSYLVNRWLTAIFVAHEDQIAELIRERDRVLEARGNRAVREDRSLEVTSEWRMPAPAI